MFTLTFKKIISAVLMNWHVMANAQQKVGWAGTFIPSEIIWERMAKSPHLWQLPEGWI